jgi:hypothetical protein
VSDGVVAHPATANANRIVSGKIGIFRIDHIVQQLAAPSMNAVS